MRSLVVVSVVLGLACASPVLPRNPAVVAAENAAFIQHKYAADAAFIQEYNRLALLAAEAPDIHIITDDKQHPEAQQYRAEEVVQDLVERVAEEAIQDQVELMAGHQAGQMAGHQAQVVPTQILTEQEIIIPRWEGPFADTIPAGVNGLPRQVTETPEVMAARQAANIEQVSTPLNQIPHGFTFQTKNAPTVVYHNQVGHLAAHMAGHLVGQHTPVFSEVTLTVEEPAISLVPSVETLAAEEPIKRTNPKKWEGPFADTVPAGVNGQQVTETPAVEKARHALYAAHAAVPA